MRACQLNRIGTEVVAKGTIYRSLVRRRAASMPTGQDSSPLGARADRAGA